MRIRLIATSVAPLLAAASLAGCDAATQIAGDAVEGELRNAVAAQCRQVSESAGIVAGRVSQVCECTADVFVEDPDLTMEDIGPARIEGIVNDCAAQTGAQTGDATGTTGSFGGSFDETTPTEEIGG